MNSRQNLVLLLTSHFFSSAPSRSQVDSEAGGAGHVVAVQFVVADGGAIGW
uniref:Uncharacterized protein n=1 Tax=Arundo donax TaxID=35708 RepID=A0A0A8ZBU8_ARUDO